MTSLPQNADMAGKLLEAALEYESFGWSVIPLKPGEKLPLLSSWSEYQQRRATDDEILQWFIDCPNANIGIVTGKISGLIVLDIDSKDALSEARKQGLLIKTIHADTSKGWHFYYRHPGGEVRNFAGKLPGVDLRGDGGYVVAAPSLHPSGKLYSWRLRPHDQELSDAPAALLKLAAKPATSIIQFPAVKLPTGKDTPYGLKGLENECNEVRQAIEGQRNHTLNKAALFIGQLVAGGELNQGTAESELTAAGIAAGLLAGEVARTIASGFKKGLTEPRSNPNPLPAAKRSDITPPKHDDQDIRETDTGNARRLVNLSGRDIRFVHESGNWLIWNEKRWSEDKQATIYKHAWGTVANMLHQAADLIKAEETRKEGQRLSAWAKASENASRLDNMVKLASRLPGIRITAEQLDQVAHILNCENGTLDLRTGKLTKHSRADLLTKIIPIHYDEDAKCPTWDRFLNRIMQGNDRLIAFIQRAIGYTLTADVSEQCLFFMHGNGKNGKSTFIETISTMLGDYGLRLGTESLMSKTMAGGIRNDLARLPGARLVVSAETEEGRRLDEPLVKDLTGGDTITARFLHREFFDFKPTHKLWMYGNHKPLIRGSDEGIWRRINLIPFEVQIPAEERDPRLLQKLQAELPGILTWSVLGCLMWQREGLNPPPEVKAATDTYRAEMDIISAWMDECLVKVPAANTPAAKLYASYKAWCDDNGEQPVSQRRLGQSLTARGFTRQRGTAGAHLYKGLGIMTRGESDSK